MKKQTFLVTITFAILGAFSGTALAGPDFSTIERGRAAKKAEQVQQSTAAKKCFSDDVATPAAPK
jgi:hypothetical protein